MPENTFALLELNYVMPEPEAILSRAPSLPSWLSAPTGTGLGTLLLFIGSLVLDFPSFMHRNSVLLAGARMKAPAWRDFLTQAGMRELGQKLEQNLDLLDFDHQQRELAIADYRQLFEAARPLIPIRESAWFKNPEPSWDKSLLELTSKAFDPYQPQSPAAWDHLGVETGICGWLYDNAADRHKAFSPDFFHSLAAPGAKRPLLNDLRAFVRQHYGRWAPQCFTLLANAAQSVFWKQTCLLAQMLAQQLEFESSNK